MAYKDIRTRELERLRKRAAKPRTKSILPEVLMSALMPAGALAGGALMLKKFAKPSGCGPSYAAFNRTVLPRLIQLGALGGLAATGAAGYGLGALINKARGLKKSVLSEGELKSLDKRSVKASSIASFGSLGVMAGLGGGTLLDTKARLRKAFSNPVAMNKYFPKGKPAYLKLLRPGVRGVVLAALGAAAGGELGHHYGKFMAKYPALSAARKARSKKGAA